VIIVAGPEDEALFRKLFSRKAQLESHMAEKGNFRAVSILQDLADKGARIRYVVQKQPRGPGDAVLAASEHVGDRPFAVMMPDDVFFTGHNPGCLAQMMKAYKEGKAENIMCAMEVPEGDIVRYSIIHGRADVDGSIFATDVTEKPADLGTVRRLADGDHGPRHLPSGYHADSCRPRSRHRRRSTMRDAQKILMRDPGRTFYYNLTAERGTRLDYGTLAGRRDAEALLALIDNPE
jgi:hypothetical protein